MSTSLLICSLPRCGASWLCEGLSATGVAGRPREYFMPAFPGADDLDAGIAGYEASTWARERGLATFPEFLTAVLSEGRSDNGVFATSLQWSSYEPMLEKIRTYTPYGGTARIRPLIRKYFGDARFVYLDRRDRIAQAVSWALARETGQYSSSQARVGAATEPDFDVARLDAAMEQIEQAQAKWESLFDLLEVEPLRLTYEDWAGDLPGTVDRIVTWLGAPGSASTVDPGQLQRRRQATGVNEDWASRYRALRPGFA